MNTERPHQIVDQIPQNAPTRQSPLADVTVLGEVDPGLPLTAQEAELLRSKTEDQRAEWLAALPLEEKLRRYAAAEAPKALPGGEAKFPILEFFKFEHLPPKLQERSRPFAELARSLADIPSRHHAEVAAGLRKLLEAKDCFVRASLP